MSLPAGPFRPGPIAPIARVGQNLLLGLREKYFHFKIASIEQIPEAHSLIVNIGAIAANTQAAANNPGTQLDLNDGQLAQYRMRVLDDIHVQVSQPAAVRRFGNLAQTATVNRFTAEIDPCGHTTEIFCFEDERPSLLATNPTDYALAQARIMFYGFKYYLYGKDGATPIGASDAIETYTDIVVAERAIGPFTFVPIGGWGR